MVDIAVIGAGAIAQQAYLPAIRELSMANLHAVVDVNEARARSAAEEFQAEQHANDYAPVSGAVDAAVVTTPPRFHADITERLLREGVHVLTEKPVATESERGHELVELADERGLHYAISRQLRESPACRTLRTFCEKSAIGDPVAVSVRYGDETNWNFASDYRLRSDLAWGGVLTDKAPHALDLLLWIFGPAGEVTAYRDDSLGGLEANAEVEMQFPGGMSATLEATADRSITNEIRVRGDGGELHADPKDDSAVLVDGDGEETMLRPASGGSYGDYLPRVAKQLERFVRAADDGRATYVPATDGVAVLEWLESCYAQRESIEYPWERRPLKAPILEV